MQYQKSRVTRHREKHLVEALTARFANVAVGDPFDPNMQMEPLAMSRQRDKVEYHIKKGVEQGARP